MHVRSLLALGAGGWLALSAFGVEVSVNRVQQRYPWNGYVDVDYTVTLGAGEAEIAPLDYDLQFTATDTATGRRYPMLVFQESVFSLASGKHTVTWKAREEGYDFVSSSVTVTATLKHYPATWAVVDISEGSGATSYPVTYLHAEPEGGFNTDAYKTDKLVLRRIHPGRYYCSMYGHGVVFTNAFYLGVFPVTQRQYVKIMGAKTFDKPGNGVDGSLYPAHGLGYANLRNNNDWPANENVGAGILKTLRDRTGLTFDLPTEAQWEYACRAGTTSAYNNGLSGWGTSDNPKTWLGNNGYKAVGQYAPNAWGLYDMHGNVYEWCLDWYNTGLTTLSGMYVEPRGASASSTHGERTARGGAWETDNCSSTDRKPCVTSAYPYYGVRLCIQHP